MTNNTIHNVPRELLERVAKPVLFKSQEDAHADACAELRALLSAPSPAGVGGLEVVGIQWLDTGHYRKKQPKYGFTQYDWNELCRLSDAQAAIAAERALVVELEQKLQWLADGNTKLHVLWTGEARKRDKLAALLREAEQAFADIGVDYWCERIDAALSAGKDSDQ